MDLLYSLLIAGGVFFLLNVTFRYAGMNFTGALAHPFSLFVILQFCILSIPGVVIISFLGYQSNRYAGIDPQMNHTIGYWYIYSFLIYFSFLFVLMKYSGCSWYNKYIAKEIVSDDYHKVFYLVIAFAIALFIIKVSLSKVSPLWYLLLGDANKAYQVRVDMQLNHDKYYLPIVSKFISQYLIYQFYFCLYYFLFIKQKSKSLFVLLSISFFLACIESLYDTQKAPLIFLLVGAIFIIYLKKKNFLKITFPLVLIFIILIILQSFVGGSDLNTGVKHAIDRFILGQNQGFYHIINSIVPDQKYWFNGFYFINQFGIDVSRADVDVLPFTIYKNSSIVNVNSYYLGEAWSMFGTVGLVISPFIVSLVSFLYIKIIDLFIGNEPLFTIPFMIYFIPSMNIQQSFNYFLYSKAFLLSFSLFLLSVLMIKATLAIFNLYSRNSASI